MIKIKNMKNLKEYLFEDFFGNVGSTPEDNKRRKTIPLIEAWLKKYNIKKYTINKDLTIDTSDGVDLRGQNFEKGEFPKYIQFNKVRGAFLVNSTNLKTLRGCPEAADEFECSDCFYLLSLEGGPKKNVKTYGCSFCSKLKTLEGAPEVVEQGFSCRGAGIETLKGAPKKVWGFGCELCPNLVSLEGAPKEVEEDFWCYGCKKLTSLKGAPTKVGGDFICSDCTGLTSLEGAPEEIGKDFYCNGCTGLETFDGWNGNVKKRIFCKRCTGLKGTPGRLLKGIFKGTTIQK